MATSESGNELPFDGYIISFVGDSAYSGLFFRIASHEPFEYTTNATSGTPEFSTVASGGSSGFKDITVLQSDKSHLRAIYAEAGFVDGFTYQMKLKSGTIRWGPDGDKNAARLNNVKDPHFAPDSGFSFWLFGQDWFPSINANNLTPWALTPQVRFKGFKYEMLQITNAEEIGRLQLSGRYMTVTLGGVPN